MAAPRLGGEHGVDPLVAPSAAVGTARGAGGIEHDADTLAPAQAASPSATGAAAVPNNSRFGAEPRAIVGRMRHRMRDVGGTPGGLFALGLGMAAGGAWVLTNQVQVHSGYWRFWGLIARSLRPVGPR